MVSLCTSEGKAPIGKLGVDGKIKLKTILKCLVQGYGLERSVREYRQILGSCYCGNEQFGFH
jgi:hypothetical protein